MVPSLLVNSGKQEQDILYQDTTVKINPKEPVSTNSIEKN